METFFFKYRRKLSPKQRLIFWGISFWASVYFMCILHTRLKIVVFIGACVFHLKHWRQFPFVMCNGYRIFHQGTVSQYAKSFPCCWTLRLLWLDIILSNAAITNLLIPLFPDFGLFLENLKGGLFNQKMFVAFTTYCQIAFQKCCTSLYCNQQNMSIWVFSISLSALLYFRDPPLPD